MLWNFNDIKGFRLHATDGDLGHVHDLLLDDRTWHVRWLVVDTGWIFGRRVLIASEALGEPDGKAETIPVRLSRHQVKDSPSIDTDKPVSRQQEGLLYRYYGWAPYWTAGGAVGMPLGPTAGLGAAGIAGGTGDFTGPPPTSGDRIATERDRPGPEAEQMGHAEGDPHLRSARELDGYTVAANDGEVGEVTGFVVDTGAEGGWRVRWIVADTGRYLASHPVILSPDWVREVDWPASRMLVNVSTDKVKGAPAYDPLRLLSRDVEEQTYDWHGVRPYW